MSDGFKHKVRTDPETGITEHHSYGEVNGKEVHSYWKTDKDGQVSEAYDEYYNEDGSVEVWHYNDDGSITEEKIGGDKKSGGDDKEPKGKGGKGKGNSQEPGNSFWDPASVPDADGEFPEEGTGKGTDAFGNDLDGGIVIQTPAGPMRIPKSPTLPQINWLRDS